MAAAPARKVAVVIGVGMVFLSVLAHCFFFSFLFINTLTGPGLGRSVSVRCAFETHICSFDAESLSCVDTHQHVQNETFVNPRLLPGLQRRAIMLL